MPFMKHNMGHIFIPLIKKLLLEVCILVLAISLFSGCSLPSRENPEKQESTEVKMLEEVEPILNDSTANQNVDTFITEKVKEEKSENFMIKPGASYGVFDVNRPKGHSYTIEVFDFNEEKVFQSEVLYGLFHLDLSVKPKGKYLIRISYHDGVFEKTIELKKISRAYPD